VKRFPFLSVAGMISLLALVVPITPMMAAPATGDAADAVWGQPNFVSVRCLHPSTITLCGPAQVVADAQGNLWVADFDNNRVLMYPPGSAIAGKVFGQYGSFATRGCNQHPPAGSHYPAAPSQYTLCQPIGVAVDQHGTLYVADSIDNRVLVYLDAAGKPSDAPADFVLGQPNFSATSRNDVPAGGNGSFTCGAPRPASRCSLGGPMELSLDARGDLLVPDLDNHRVLMWSASTLAAVGPEVCARRCFIPASRVWGQYGSFATDLSNNPGIPPDSSPRCTIITVATPASACTLSDPWATLVDGRGDLFVADTANNRVLEYADAIATGRQDASMVYGQDGNFVNSRTAGYTSASSLWHPVALAQDPDGNVWVADLYDSRVLEFPQITTANPTVAVRVLGQGGNLTATTCGHDASALCGPYSIAFDRAGHGFVADGFNSRVLEVFAPLASVVRVVSLTVTRRQVAGRGSFVTFRWQTASQDDVARFDVYAGAHRLNARPIGLEGSGSYRYQARWQGKGPFTLAVILRSGQTVTVQAGP